MKSRKQACDFTYDEDVLALEAGDLLESLLDTLADLNLVAVHLGEIEMAVAGLESLVDALADLARGGLPGAVAQSAGRWSVSRVLGTSGELRQTHGIWAPVLRVALFPKDMVGSVKLVCERRDKQQESGYRR